VLTEQQAKNEGISRTNPARQPSFAGFFPLSLLCFLAMYQERKTAMCTRILMSWHILYSFTAANSLSGRTFTQMVQVQELDQAPRSLPNGTSIVEVYDEADGQLLILGEPGSGKTTLLLELTRNLLERAQVSESSPMPVIFNLSSWAKRRLPLVKWLVEELRIGDFIWRYPLGYFCISILFSLCSRLCR